jgi:integrase
MSLSPAELEDLLRLALSALRGQVREPAAIALAQPESVQAGQTLAEWLVTYRQIIGERGYKVQTIKNRGAALKHIETILGARPLRAIKPHEIAVKLKLFTPHTAGRILGELRDVYVEAIANGAAETSPAAHVKPPRAPGLRKRLTLETWQAMLTLAKTGPQRWVVAMLLLALATGQRRADLAKMRFDDVVDGHLRIEQQKKARKPIGARVAIPLTLRLNATEMTLGDVVELCRSIGAPGPTLLRKAGGGPIEMSSLSARFHECIVAVCGADAYKQFEWPSLHEVRSLSARTYIAEGMAPVVVQTLLGHKHAEMTALYLDDRGLTDAEWKFVDLSAGATISNSNLTNIASRALAHIAST